MAEILVRLEKLRREVYAPAAHPLNGEIVFHTGTIIGGTDYGTYPENCRLGVEIGTQPGETMRNRIDEIGKIFADVAKIHPDLETHVETKIARDPFEARGHEEIYDVYASALERVTGKKAEATGGNSWGDAQLFQDAGFPTIGVGAMGENLHAPDEWVSIGELEQLVRVITAVAVTDCGG
jgi:acetylornithine deacetylase